MERTLKALGYLVLLFGIGVLFSLLMLGLQALIGPWATLVVMIVICFFLIRVGMK